jgi:RNA polymerase sigma-70 factor (ECF subfamily)
LEWLQLQTAGAQRVTQITGLDAREATAKQADRSGSARVWAGDQYLHEEILVHLPRLERFARALTHDVVSADDLVQDCLARALEKIHLWEPGTDLRAWLFTILYRQHISHTRRNARHREGVERQESDASSVFPPNQTARLELRDLERGLAKLPEEQRSVILLVGLEGMDYAEAAAAVNTPVGTVRSRIARGRESLRQATGLFPARHSRRKEIPAVRREASAAPKSQLKSQEVVQ